MRPDGAVQRLTMLCADIEIVPDRYSFEGQPVVSGWGVVPAKCCVSQATGTRAGVLLVMTDGELLLASGSSSPRVFSHVPVSGGKIGANASLLIGSGGMPIGTASSTAVRSLSCRATTGNGSSPLSCTLQAEAAADLGTVYDTSVVPAVDNVHDADAHGTANRSSIAFIAAANGLFRAVVGPVAVSLTQVITKQMASGASRHDKYPPSAIPPTPMLATAANTKLVAAGNSVKVWLLNHSGAVLSWSWVTGAGWAAGAGGVYDDATRSMEARMTVAELFH